MKCQKCYGYGWVLSIVPKNNGECITERVPCEFCHGSGEVQITNEEYLRSCTTEQLAEWIAKIVDCDCCPVKRKFCDDNPCKIRFIEWLKQPHTKEER